MTAFLTRVAERALGRGNALRPVVNRYLVAVRDDDARGTLAPANVPAVTPNGGSVKLETPLRVGRGDAPPRDDARARIDAGVVTADAAAVRQPTPAAASAELVHLMPQPADSARAEAERSQPDRAQPERVSSQVRTEPRLLPLERAPASIIERAPSGAPAEPPTVHVHIGRIDVRAIEASPAKPAPDRTAPRGPSLAEHLRARERNVR